MMPGHVDRTTAVQKRPRAAPSSANYPADCDVRRSDGDAVSRSLEIYPAKRVAIETIGEINLSALEGDGDMRYSDTPEANRHDNTRRAGFALAAVQEYARVCNEADEEPEIVISDFLGDLRHLCDAVGLSFEALSDHGDWHYQAEVTGNWA